MSLNTVIPQSPREQCAERLANFAVCADLAQVYAGGYAKRTDKKGKPYWSVNLCKARTLDAEIMVYSDRFLVLKWQTAYRQLPARGSEIFKKEEDLKAFLTKYFVF